MDIWFDFNSQHRIAAIRTNVDGIENNIFEEFSGCTNPNIDLLDKSKIIESLNNNLPNCKEVNFKIFGFSLATINLFISIIISLYTLKLLINEKNRSK